MNIKDLTNLAAEIDIKYRSTGKAKGYKDWTSLDYASGLTGDLGDLVKLLQMKNGYRDSVDQLDAKLEHELADCLWSILLIAKKLDIDLEQAFSRTMSELHQRFE